MYGHPSKPSLPVFASLNSLYHETGWETLSKLSNKKLSLLYKIINNEAPEYLSNLPPNRIGEQTHHNLRNNQNYEIPFSRLCSYESSFFPSALRLWNELDTVVRNSSTLNEFKQRIRNTNRIPTNFKSVSKERIYEIALTRIKHNCSSLNADLCRVKNVPSAICSCGGPSETSEHYFFHCPLYNIPRIRLLASIPIVPITLNTLLYGHEAIETNEVIYYSVLQFIKESVDFLNLNYQLFDIQIINENVYAITTCYVTLAFCFMKIHLCLLIVPSR